MVLRIFPENCLAESVTTTVWIGVTVFALINLRFGWTLSGLVIPGYLVPLIIVKPAAAFMVFIEGVLSYLMVAWFSKHMTRHGLWSSFFGRDRFFALILASILVKVGLDGYLVPELIRWSQETWAVNLDLSNNLHSFGLIVVALIGNQFWKPGLLRGLGPFAFTVLVTYLIVRFPLMLLTNFNIGNLEYMYEHIATSLLASPKAYVIMIITAFMASRMNLAYSWDFNGILIPALLSLQWYTPLKVFSSFFEAWVVYFAGTLVLKLPMFKETTMEGARKILLFFNLSFAYKILVGHGGRLLWPGMVPTDYYGFGYLLPSLMAMKMHDKGIPLRLTRTTLQTSFVGAAVACVVGFALHRATDAVSRASAEPSRATVELRQETGPSGLAAAVAEYKKQLYEMQSARLRLVPLQRELERFSRGMRSLKRHLEEGSEESLASARAWLDEVGYSIRVGQDGLLYVEERPPRRGWGAYVVSPAGASRLLVEVPAAGEEWATTESGACLFALFGARSLAISTSAPRRGVGASSEALAGYSTFFNAFHGVFADADVLSVRGYTESTVRRLEGMRLQAGSDELERLTSSLWIHGSVPPSVGLSALKGLLKSIRVRWDAPGAPNVLRAQSPGGYADLFLSRRDRKRLLARFQLGASLGADSAPPEVSVARESLGRWLAEAKADIPPRGSGLYVRPSTEALLYMDEEVLKPLLEMLIERPEASEQDDEVDLAAIRAAARSFDYAITRLRTPDAGLDFLLLSEIRDSPSRRYWGTYLFRRRGSSRVVVQVPHPLSEENTLEYGLALFEKLDAACLMVAGAHPACNPDGSADVVLPTNLSTFFNLASQVVLRETRDSSYLVVQVRALGARPRSAADDVDALLAVSGGKTERFHLSLLESKVTWFLDEERISWRFVDGDEETGGYEVYGSAQSAYLQQTKNKSLVSLWLSPYVRLNYRSYVESAMQSKHLSALGIASREGSLAESLLGREARVGHRPDDALPELLLRYYRFEDVASLYAIQSTWPEIRLERIVDPAAQRPFLVLHGPAGIVPVVLSLSFNRKVDGADLKAATFTVAGPITKEAVDAFTASGKALLAWDPAAVDAGTGPAAAGTVPGSLPVDRDP